MPLPNDVTSLLRVRLDQAVIGLPAQAVREIVRAVAITPLLGAPAIIEGAINIRGDLVAVVDIRQRLAMPPVALDPAQFLVVLTVGDRTLAVRVDDVDDLVDVEPSSVSGSDGLSPTLRGLRGLSAQPDGVLVIHDPESFISQAEADALDAALAPRS